MSPIFSFSNNLLMSPSASADTARAAFARSESTTSCPSFIAVTFLALIGGDVAFSSGVVLSDGIGTETSYVGSCNGCRENLGGDKPRCRLSFTIASNSLLLWPDSRASSSNVKNFVCLVVESGFASSATFTANFSSGFNEIEDWLVIVATGTLLLELSSSPTTTT